MARADVRLRIRVIVVSTRAGVRSLAPGDSQATDVIQRGQTMLEALAASESDPADLSLFEEGRAELTALADGPVSREHSGA